jgi:hypothetical protein
VRPIAKFLLLAVVLPGCAFAGAGGSDSTDRADLGRATRPQAARKIEPAYKVSAGIKGDVYPAFANYASLQKPADRKWGVVAVTVTNTSDSPLRNRIAVSVSGWSDTEIQMVEVAVGDQQTFIFAPSFLPRLFENHEIRAAVAKVSVTDPAGNAIEETTVPVRLRASEDMYWGAKFQYAPFIASWVTPHDRHVEQTLKRAKEFMSGRRLPGYEDWKSAAEQETSTSDQAKAIYKAMKQMGVSYVKSSLTFGSSPDVSQRIRTPRESLGDASANCIDAVVLFASAFENLGMDPSVVLVPGHAYVAVKVAEGSDKLLYIDPALIGRVGFEASVESAQNGLAKFNSSQINIIRVNDARQAGIFPMPLPDAGY